MMSRIWHDVKKLVMTLKYGMTSLTSKRSAKHTKITSLDVHCMSIRDWRDPWRTLYP